MLQLPTVHILNKHIQQKVNGLGMGGIAFLTNGTVLGKIPWYY